MSPGVVGQALELYRSLGPGMKFLVLLAAAGLVWAGIHEIFYTWRVIVRGYPPANPPDEDYRDPYEDEWEPVEDEGEDEDEDDLHSHSWGR